MEKLDFDLVVLAIHFLLSNDFCHIGFIFYVNFLCINSLGVISTQSINFIIRYNITFRMTPLVFYHNILDFHVGVTIMIVGEFFSS